MWINYLLLFKNQYSKNDKAIGLKSDGKDYSNVDFGENVGDGRGFAEFKEALKYGASDRNIVNYLQVTDVNLMTWLDQQNWYHCMIRNEMVKNEKDNFFRRSFVIFYIFSFK